MFQHYFKFSTSTKPKRKHKIILIVWIITMFLEDSQGATATCAKANQNKKCCSGQDDKCRTSSGGVFCWCDEHCLLNNDCCSDYNIKCVPGSNTYITNTNTAQGPKRQNNIMVTPETATEQINTSLPPIITEEITSSTPTSTQEMTSSTPITTQEITSSTPTTIQEITSSTPTTTQEITSSTPTTTQEITSSTPTTTQEITSSTPTTTQEITSSTPTTTHEESSSIPISCGPVPTWLNLESNITTAHPGEVITYQCSENFQFEDLTTYKEMSCGADGVWSDSFQLCSAITDPDAKAQFSEPVEAPGAVYIGSISLIFLILEAIIIIILDIPHYTKRFRAFIKLLKSRTISKPDTEMAPFTQTQSVQSSSLSADNTTTDLETAFNDLQDVPENERVHIW